MRRDRKSAVAIYYLCQGWDRRPTAARDARVCPRLETLEGWEVPAFLPVAADDSPSLSHTVTGGLIDVLANDTDGDSDPLHVAAVDATSAEGGSVWTDGTYVYYTPPAAFVGTDSFSYTAADGVDGDDAATVTVDVTNQAAVGYDFGIYTIPLGGGDMLVTGYDPDGDPLTISILTQPAHGTAWTNGTDTIYYTSTDPTWAGTDWFEYRIEDPFGAYDTRTFAPVVQNLITVEATDPTATEGGADGVFTVRLYGWHDSDVTVLFTLAGSATDGTDYTSLSPYEVTVPYGLDYATVTIDAADDFHAEGDETVVLTLVQDGPYPTYSVHPGRASATVTVRDNDFRGGSPPPVFAPPPPCPCDCPAEAVIDEPTTAGANADGGNGTNPARYADGTVKLSSADLASGGGWGHVRSWTNGAGYAAGGENGSGWVVSQIPRLIPIDGDGVLALVVDGQTAWYFDKQLDGSYVRRFPGTLELAYDAGTDSFVLTTGTGTRVTFGGFSSALPQFRRGQFEARTDAAGVTTAVTAWTGEGRVAEVRSTANGVTESFVYAYVASGANAGLLASVTLRRSTDAGATWAAVESVAYEYYDGVEAHGNAGDLKTATRKDAAGAAVSTDYYRYYTAGEPGGYQHGLKYAVLGAAFDRLAEAEGGTAADAFDADDEDVGVFANHYFEYDGTGRATLEVASGAGCSACSGGLGTLTFTVTASANPAGYNSWATRTVETQPDGTQHVVYTNAYGQVMLKAVVDPATSREWVTYYRFDADGRVVLRAEASAVSGYDDGYADLVHFDGGDAEYLRDDAGLLIAYTYYSSTTATGSVAGGVAGYQQGVALRHGEFGADVPQTLVDYLANTDANGVIVYQVASQTVYRDDAGLDPITTSYAYTYHTGTNAVESVVTTLPVVGTGQNGSGVAAVVTTAYDQDGRPVWSRDAAGVISYTEYDAATGAVVKQIADVDTDLTGDFAGLPTGWVNAAGQHRVSTFEVDTRGRVVKATGPDGRIDYTIYNDAAHEVRYYAAWDDTADAPTGPTVVTREDRTRGYTETFEMTAVPAVDGSGRPTGAEAVSGLVSLSRSIVNAAGQTVATRAYFDLTGLTYTQNLSLGTEGTHYYETTYAYDNHGLLNKTVTATGTIYRTVYDGLGRAVSEWVGTNDTPVTGFWSPDNAADMVKVAEYAYDGGGVGDSNLTRVTRFSGVGTVPDRVTEYAYDWRGRVVGVKAGVESVEAGDVNRPITVYEYDNLGNVTRTRVYDGDGEDLTDGGELVVPDAELLRTQTRTSYDDWGRAYKTEVDGVDPTDGTVGETLTSETWYDERGLVRKQTSPNAPVAKYAYDSLGQLVAVYTTDGAGDADYNDALSVSDDTVLEQVEYAYDLGGRTIQTTVRQRFHDATGDGPLGDPSSLSDPKARVYYSGSYYDLAGRLVGTVDVGTNAGVPWTRPGSLPSPTGTELVTTFEYDDAGYLTDVTDPAGIVTRTTYDALGRTLSTIADFGGQNKTTLYAYNSAGMTSLTAVNPGGADQVTEWVYGVTVAGGSGIDSNDVVGATRWPDPTTGLASSGEEETVTVSALGQTLTSTDRNGTKHVLSYDAVGRLVADVADDLGVGIDGAVRRREYRYDTLGNGVLFTTFDAVAAGDIVTQVAREYNGFGQLAREYQSHAGAVVTGGLSPTPAVGYNYTEGVGGNHSRLTSIEYPDGRLVSFDYASGVDDVISRLSGISDGSGDLELYTYLGLGTVVERSHPEAGLTLTYVKQGLEPDGDGGDQYAGLDRFGRVVDQRWVDGLGVDLDRYQYGYDAAGNRTFRDNLVNGDFGEVYTYDALNQLGSFQRGELNLDRDGLTGAADREQEWDLDALGNWNTVTTDGVDEDRTHNAQNQLTSVENAASPTFDAAGNMTGDETGKTYEYDAWNRLVRVRDALTAVVAEYGYDALNRRVTEDYGAGATHLYYSAGWQVLEERDAGGDTTAQYVWSPVYVDAMVLRDRATTTPGTLDERLYVTQDANWNVTALVGLVDGDGPGGDPATWTVVERYVNDPFGAYTVYSDDYVTVRPVSDYDWQYEFQGLRRDEATGNLYMRNRDYSVTLGTFTSVDPIGFGGGDVRLYGFVGNNPGNYTDPSGLVFWIGFLPVVGELVGGGIAGLAGTATTTATGVGLTGVAVGVYSVGQPFYDNFEAVEAGKSFGSWLNSTPKPSAPSIPTYSLALPAGKPPGQTATNSAFDLKKHWGKSCTSASLEPPFTLSLSSATSTNQANKPCFPAGTPVRTPDGWRNIEDLRVSDLVLSRDEFDPNGPVLTQAVEEVFVNSGLIWNLHVGGQVIQTTAEHPFFVKGRGWVPCNELRVGDLLATEVGGWVPVEDLLDTGEWKTLYNFRVANFHTYFVGVYEWGFSVWTHNKCWYHGTDSLNAAKIITNGPNAADYLAAAERIDSLGLFVFNNSGDAGDFARFQTLDRNKVRPAGTPELTAVILVADDKDIGRFLKPKPGGDPNERYIPVADFPLIPRGAFKYSGIAP